MMIKNHKDFFAGLMFCAIGLAFAIGATNYKIGEGARMGPGYFPIMLGVILALIGVVILLTGLGSRRVEKGQVGRWAW
ncbi:MAG: tripartite tricarboxylate transporter TctB family protein, partial [Burkholderiaceae bacterium]|nr:tripartite tricarboxylate transporter TctB family protein [Burkholderiaceae bacterium]